MPPIAERDAVIDHHLATLAQRDQAILCKDAKIAQLTCEIARLRRLQFSAKSERMDPAQRELFDEAMAADIAALESGTGCTAHADDNPGRLPWRSRADLPRIETIHEPAACDCATCGAALVKIGEHVTARKLDVEPLKFFVRRDVHPQYACRACGTITASPVASSILIAASPFGLLAQVVIQKYTDHLPLYRQQAIFARHGIELSRSTLAEWIGVVGVRLQPLVEALKTKLPDRTHPACRRDPGGATGPGRRQDQAGLSVCLTRQRTPNPLSYSTTVPAEPANMPKPSWGNGRVLTVDDYVGYKALFATGITELACWAHARRVFFDAHKASASPLAEA